MTRQEVKKLVELQKQHGVKAVSDGEFSRTWWHLDFLAELDGMDWQETEVFNVNFTGHKPKGQTVKSLAILISPKATLLWTLIVF